MPTDDFRKLYDIVTEELFRHEETVNDDESEWMLSLMVWFWSEFRHWTTLPESQQFLTTLNDPRIPREVKIACCVLLHIGYDLPRCIALSMSREQSAYLALQRTAPVVIDVCEQSDYLALQRTAPAVIDVRESPFRCLLSLNPEPPGPEDEASTRENFRTRVSDVRRTPVGKLLETSLGDPAIIIPRSSQRTRYANLNAVFRQLLTNENVTKLFADMAPTSRFLLRTGATFAPSATGSVQGILCNWIIALRSNAWMQAENIIAAKPPERVSVCNKLFLSVTAVREEALKRVVHLNRRWWNPLFIFSKLAGLSELRSPDLVFGLSILAILLIFHQGVFDMPPILAQQVVAPGEAPPLIQFLTRYWVPAILGILFLYFWLARLVRRQVIEEILDRMAYDFKFWQRHYLGTVQPVESATPRNSTSDTPDRPPSRPSDTSS